MTSLSDHRFAHDWLPCVKCHFRGPHQVIPKSQTVTKSENGYSVYLKRSRLGGFIAELPEFKKESIKVECPECGDSVDEVDPLWYFCDSCEHSFYVASNKPEEPVLYAACAVCGNDDYFDSLHYHHWDYADERGIKFV